MRTYIKNLTDNLIGKHGFDLVFDSMRNSAAARGWKESSWKEQFVEFVHLTINAQDIRAMSDETLGKVFCSIEESDIPAVSLNFFGNPERFLRDSISRLLAYTIRYRIDAARGQKQGKIPPYLSSSTGRHISLACKAVIDGETNQRADERTLKVGTTKEAVRLTLSTGLVDDSDGVMPAVLDYLEENPGAIIDYGMLIQEAYHAEDRRTPIVKLALTIKLALKR